MDEEQITIETMICYLIEANKNITDSKDKLLRNYIVAVRKELENKNKFEIKDRINTMEISKYFNNVTDKWLKVKKKLVVNYAALIFNRLLNYSNFTDDDIIRNTKFVIDKYTTTDEMRLLDDSYSLIAEL